MGRGEITRDYTVAVFVISCGKTLLLYHKKHNMWLPPGGHIEENETPDHAAVRETLEETGIDVTLIGDKGLPIDTPEQLVTPEGIQLEQIGPAINGHQHVDLIYFAVPSSDLSGNIDSDPPSCRISDESEDARWVSVEELDQIYLNEDVRLWSERALATVDERLKIWNE